MQKDALSSLYTKLATPWEGQVKSRKRVEADRRKRKARRRARQSR